MISDERLLDFCRALNAAVRSGLPLSDAFATLAKARKHGRHIARAAELTYKGIPLHEAFEAQKIFPKVFIALVRAGEEGGKTDEFLDVYADCLQVRIEFRRRIERLLAYPAFAVVVAAGLLLFVSFKVIPSILEPLIAAGAPVPRQALLITDLASRLYDNWPPLVVGAVVFILAARAFIRSGLGRKAGSIAGHFLPLFRFATEEARYFYQYTIMGLLFKAGLPLSAMMDILQQFSQDDPISRRRFREAAGLVGSGRGFTESISKLLPPEDRQSLEVAEKAGRLDDTLLSRGKLHYDKHLHRLKLLVTGFTISTMAGLALLAFALIIALIWPVLSVLSGGVEQGPVPQPAAAVQPVRRTGPKGPLELKAEAAEAATRIFNQAHGDRIRNLLQGRPDTGESGPAAEEKSATAQAEEQKAAPQKKKLTPITPMKKLQFNSAQPTQVQPTGIDSH